MARAKAWQKAGFAEEAKDPKGELFYCDPEQLNIVEGDNDLLSDRRTRGDIKQSLEFMADIATLGVHTPVIASQNGETMNMDIVYGRQRVRAARALNDVEALEQFLNTLAQDDAEAEDRPAVIMLREWIDGASERGQGLLVPVIVRNDLSEAEKLQILISENEHRTGDTPVNKALKMRRLLKVCKDKVLVANTFGYKSAPSVDQHLELLRLSKTVQNAIDDGTVKMSRALKWRAMPHSHQNEELRSYKEKVASRGGRNLRRTDGPPSKKKLQAFIDSPGFQGRVESQYEWDSSEVLRLLEWITGAITSSDACGCSLVIEQFLSPGTAARTARRMRRGNAPSVVVAEAPEPEAEEVIIEEPATPVTYL